MIVGIVGVLMQVELIFLTKSKYYSIFFSFCKYPPDVYSPRYLESFRSLFSHAHLIRTQGPG